MSTVIDCKNETDWLAERRKGIGASDAPVILGLVPSKSPYALYAEKVGEIGAENLSEIERIKWGHRFQVPIGNGFAEDVGRSVIHWAPFTIAVHIEHDWMRCTPDAEQISKQHDYKHGLLEIKLASSFLRDEWEDEAPLTCQVQLQHQLAVVGAEWGTVCAVVGGNELRWFDMERNDSFIEAMIDEEGRFWDRVMRKNPPPIDESVATSKALQRLHPQDSGDTIEFPAEADEWDQTLRDAKAQIKELEADKVACENSLKAALGDATYGLLLNGGCYSWRTQYRKAYDVMASSRRVLLRLK